MPSINISQEELSQRINSTKKYISDIETCKSGAGADFIDKLAIALNIEPYELLMPHDFSKIKPRIDSRK